ncbi:MAG: phosphonate C-P lyase system protein PhnG [Rubrobacter sp.]|nr:phosphonate C-P lyase system protein PhnG [Rubrobacter sp.]
MTSAQETYEAIAYASPESLKRLADRCLQEAGAKVTSAPQAALVMARTRETVDNEVFNLGEVLVTSCEVDLDGEPGWGMVPGHDPERALCAAIVDAASRREGAEELRAELAMSLESTREARRERWAGVQSTRVEFEEMA